MTTRRAALTLSFSIFCAVSLAGQLASRPSDEWIKTLESPARVARLRVDDVIGALHLQPGQVVADLGAGTGLFSVQFARIVGASGRVYAVDIDRGLVDHIAKKSQEEKLSNLRPILGAPSDPKLPAADVDVAFIHDVLHHIEDRTTYLKNLAGYLKPSARIVIVDYRPGHGGHQDDPTLQVSEEEGARMLAPLGFKPIETIALFDDKWFVVFGR